MSRTTPAPKIIHVRANNPKHDGRWRAKRFWPNDSTVRVEVTADPAHQKMDEASGQPEVGLPLGTDGKPDPLRVNLAAYAQLRGDRFLSILGDSDLVESVSKEEHQAALDALKAAQGEAAEQRARAEAAETAAHEAGLQVDRSAASLTEARLRIDGLEQENGSLRSRIKSLPVVGTPVTPPAAAAEHVAATTEASTDESKAAAGASTSGKGGGGKAAK